MRPILDGVGTRKRAILDADLTGRDARFGAAVNKKPHKARDLTQKSRDSRLGFLCLPDWLSFEPILKGSPKGTLFVIVLSFSHRVSCGCISSCRFRDPFGGIQTKGTGHEFSTGRLTPNTLFLLTPRSVFGWVRTNDPRVNSDGAIWGTFRRTASDPTSPSKCWDGSLPQFSAAFSVSLVFEHDARLLMHCPITTATRYTWLQCSPQTLRDLCLTTNLRWSRYLAIFRQFELQRSRHRTNRSQFRKRQYRFRLSS